MSLSSIEFDRLHKALMSTFPDRNDLAMLVKVGLNENLETVAGIGNLRDVVFTLIRWAEAHGQDRELVTQAYIRNPGNPMLKEFVEFVPRLVASGELEKARVRAAHSLPADTSKPSLPVMQEKVGEIETIRSASAVVAPMDLVASQDVTDKPSRVLIMKGGGIKGLAYVGALKELCQYYDFHMYAGTSAGAITAVLLGAGYSVEALEKILTEKDFTDFKDAKWWQLPINLIFLKGLYPATAFTIWLEKLLSKQLDQPTQVLLSELPKRVSVYASRRDTEAQVFDSHSESSVPAAFAVRCSMSIPFMFVPTSQYGMRVFDGGLRHNFPVDILLRDSPGEDFIGLYLGAEHFEGQNTAPSILTDVMACWMEANDAKVLRTYHDRIVVIDPRPISTLDFKLTPTEKEFLLAAGSAAALKFLSRRDHRSPEAKTDAIKKAQEAAARVDELRQTVVKARQRKRARKIVWGLTSVLMLGFAVYGGSIVVKHYQDSKQHTKSSSTGSGQQIDVENTVNDLLHSAQYDSNARALMDKLATAPAVQHQSTTDGLMRLAQGHQGVEFRKAADENLFKRVDANVQGDQLLVRLSSIHETFKDEADAIAIDEFFKQKWNSDPRFRTQIVDIISKMTVSSNSDSSAKDYLPKFLYNRATEGFGDPKKEAQAAITKLLSLPLDPQVKAIMRTPTP